MPWAFGTGWVGVYGPHAMFWFACAMAVPDVLATIVFDGYVHELRALAAGVSVAASAA